MKNLLICSAFLVVFANAALAATFQCQGVQGTTGEITLNVTPSASDAQGSYDDETQKSNSISCDAEFERVTRGFAYYPAKKEVTCPADYIRVPVGMSKGKAGVVALVSRTGGDTHDYSGYTYLYFDCK